ncbi:hypothetical protein [Hoeflea poritis]|uniref:Uncharacterized protein n=1 Tax=Hoeflea poritis TaxID=2993659 RepID=A0ABT4VH00_9HYPH|nr:hypothetical protein [Hoeflea poritis]MDA4843971.1 hypothetical protein [Hoeflea poritis]
MPTFEIETPGGRFEVDAADHEKAVAALRRYVRSSTGYTGYVLPIRKDSLGEVSLAVPRLLSDIWAGAKDAITLPGDVARGRYNLPMLDEPGIAEDDAGNVYRHGKIVGNRTANERSFLDRAIGLGGMAVGTGTGLTATQGARRALDPSVLRSGGGGRRIPFHRRSTSSPKEFSEEIASVLETGISSRGRLFREDLGEITIDLGVPGDPKKRFQGGWGLSHIKDKRTAEGLDGTAFVGKLLPQILSKGKLSFERSGRGRRNAVLDFGDYQANLRLERHGRRETWLLTGFQKVDLPR